MLGFKSKPKRGSIKRELPLIHFFTFKSGEDIYTYRPEDWGKISSRYQRATQEAQNYLQTFAMTKKEWESSCLKLKERGTKALADGQGLDIKTAYKMLVDHTLDVNSTMDWFLLKASGLKGANEVLLETLYCFFYVLEDERETGYSEHHNQKKIELLNTCTPEERDFFLSRVRQIMDNLFPISEEDILNLILEMEKMKERLTYLHSPTA